MIGLEPDFHQNSSRQEILEPHTSGLSRYQIPDCKRKLNISHIKDLLYNCFIYA